VCCCLSLDKAGLAFLVKLDKGEFIGCEALLRQKEKDLTRRLIIFTLSDPGQLLFREEPILRNGQIVRRITHGAYAHYYHNN
jgi:4-methylaminobutanoate oxidase (formaldehyde-forming)